MTTSTSRPALMHLVQWLFHKRPYHNRVLCGSSQPLPSDHDLRSNRAQTLPSSHSRDGNRFVSPSSSCISKTLSSAAVLVYVPARVMRSIRSGTPPRQPARIRPVAGQAGLKPLPLLAFLGTLANGRRQPQWQWKNSVSGPGLPAGGPDSGLPVAFLPTDSPPGSR